MFDFQFAMVSAMLFEISYVSVSDSVSQMAFDLPCGSVFDLPYGLESEKPLPMESEIRYE